MTYASVAGDLLRLATEMGNHLLAFPRGPDSANPGLAEYQRTLTAWTQRRDEMHRAWERLCRALAATITLDPVTPGA